MTWPTVKLSDVAKIDRNGIDPKKMAAGARYLGLEHIESGGDILGAQTVENGELASTKFRFNADHILYGKLRPYLGKIALPDFSGICSTDILPIKPGKHIDRRFLAYFLRLPENVELASSRSTGVNLPRLSPKTLADFDVPLPPLADQRRIATILDKSDGIRRKREQALEMVGKTIDSTFLEFFGDPERNPKGWPELAMGELGVVQGGLQVSKKRDELSLRRPYLRVANVFRDRLDLIEIKEIGLTQSEFERVQLREGDVLIVEGHGNQGEIGRAAVWDGSIPDCVHQNHLIRFRADRSLVLPEYISRMLNSQGGRQQLIAAGRTTSGLNTISTKKVKEVVVPIPPVELQKQFKELLQKYQALARNLKCDKNHADGLFKSLSQRAFRGEL